MTQKWYTTNRRKFKHLTKTRTNGNPFTAGSVQGIQIAKAVGISRSTIYNELKRRAVEQMDSNLRTYTRYFSDVGQTRGIWVLGDGYDCRLEGFFHCAVKPG